ncbi:hypothetical protein Bbelb_097450 [Branchiostoma belcheri]|nr:hypothetical protein Bbelb_097450 [Branchiostoma belcheri]
MACLRKSQAEHRSEATASTTQPAVQPMDSGKTAEDPGPEAPHSARNLHAPLASSQGRMAEQQRVKWPASSSKEWSQFDQDVDKILESVSRGSVDQKLRSMGTIIMSMGVERFGAKQRGKARDPVKPNRREAKIRQHRQELKSLRRRFKVSTGEERVALAELTHSLRGKIRTLRRAEYHRRRGRERARKRSAFISNPYGFTKRLLGQKRSGTLNCSVQEINSYLCTTFSDAARDADLGPCSLLVSSPEPETQFDSTEPTLKEVKEAVKAARASSAPGPSGVPYKVYKHCPRLVVRLWKALRVVWRRGKVADDWRKAEGVWIPKEENAGNIEQFRLISLLSVEGKIFFKIVAQRLIKYLLDNQYIDTSVQKGGVPGVPGCMEHTGVVTQLIREARENKGNLAVLWLDLANAYGSIPHKLVEAALTRHHVPEAIRNLILDYYSCKDKAELLNDIFVQTASGSNYPDHMKRLPQYTNKELTHIQLSVEEVYNVLQGLHVNKAPGPDGIPNRLLKEAAPVVSASLCELFNYSLATGQVPTEWKQSNITPVYKKGEKTDPHNYRPIALLSTVGKILERLVHNRLYAFLTDNALLNPKQSGFRKGDGTVLQLLRIIDDWAKSIDDADVACTAAVFLDVRRAFDTVWHDGLIYKLSRYGIHGPLINWFSDYLSDRQQRVVINGEASSWGFPTAGVPQGSILGPLLFVLYLNDIKDLPCKSSINCFADDTSLYNSGRTAAEVASTTNADLNLVATWFQDWALQLHPDKCKVMCIRSPQSKVKLPPIYIADQLVEEVTTYTHLGVTMHYTLRWKEHAENVSSKSNKVLGLLSKLQRKLPREALEAAYNTLVRTKLEYASVLFSNISTTACKTLEQVQYQAGRLVSGAMARTPRLKLLEELEWDSLAARRDYNRLLIMYKLVSGSVPPHLQVLIPTTRDSQRQLQVRLRNDAHLHVPFCRTATYRNSFVPYTTRLWNSLPSEVRESASYSQFRQRCRAHILSTRHHQTYRRLGDRQNNILTTRLRLDWSQLNSTLAKFKLTSRSCSCGATSETVAHFLLSCPLYEDARQTLATEVRRLTDRPLSTNILLNGYPGHDPLTDQNLSAALHTYISSTNRF